VSVNEVEAPQFNLFPNPTRDMFTITSNEFLSGIVVRSVTGEIVFSKENLNTKFYQVDKDFASGLYTIEVIAQKGKFARKLVIN
jgi:hypothetical protein